jgi:hypothetical protein
MMRFGNSARSLWLVVRRTLGGSPKVTVVICPKAKLPAEVGTDAVHRLQSCSRWIESEGCSQTCMPQIQFCAEELAGFKARCEGTTCMSCGVTLTADDWYNNRLMAIEPETGIEKSVLGPSLPNRNVPFCSNCFRARMH